MLYEGTKLKKPYKVGDKVEISAYIPSDDLKNAVNLAILLEKPLLLMGEPGCGKTRLAEAVAYELYEKDYAHFYFRWDIKSTSKAREGLYRYDALGHLRDVNMVGKTHTDNKGSTEIKVEHYISKGELGKALHASKPGKPAIVLIDEVDKAGIDFPNDLLLELDKNEYVIEETGERVPAPSQKPLIFITSNREKELPPAFLRRCIYYFIEFPKDEQMIEILKSHFETAQEEMIDRAVKAFYEIREQMDDKLSGKKISTSELIDWYKMLEHCRQLKNSGKPLSDPEQRLVDQLDWLGTDKIPFRQILLKGWASHLQHIITKT